MHVFLLSILMIFFASPPGYAGGDQSDQNVIQPGDDNIAVALTVNSVYENIEITTVVAPDEALVYSITTIPCIEVISEVVILYNVERHAYFRCNTFNCESCETANLRWVKSISATYKCADEYSPPSVMNLTPASWLGFEVNVRYSTGDKSGMA